jgi:hypothetical protein
LTSFKKTIIFNAGVTMNENDLLEYVTFKLAIRNKLIMQGKTDQRVTPGDS